MEAQRNEVLQLINGIRAVETDKEIIDKDSYTYDLIKKYIGADNRKVSDVLEALRTDHNLVSSTVIKKLINDEVITTHSLEKIGINRKFIDALSNLQRGGVYHAPDKDLDKVKNTSTEVYFWGIPASGKTCAIGALLSMAIKSDLKDIENFEERDCQGSKYMRDLCQMFPYAGSHDKHVVTLPSRTPVKYTYEMSFELTARNKKVYPITFIDMAGELVRCMYKKNQGEQLDKVEEEALKTVTNVLKDNRTNNQKLHFFVLEYGGENRQYEGVTQMQYLREAISYLSKIKDGKGKNFDVFKEMSDGIYLLVTQVDKAGIDDQDLKTHMTGEYLIGPESYNSVANLLRAICKKNHINGDELAIVMFSLGEVCFKNYCLFDPRFTRNVFEIMLSHMANYNARLKIPLVNKIHQMLTNNG